jgi:hypothetical protein
MGDTNVAAQAITTIVVVVTDPSEVVKKTSIAGCVIHPIRTQ